MGETPMPPAMPRKSWRAIFFGGGELEAFVSGIEREVAEFGAAAIADGDFGDEEVEERVDDDGGDEQPDTEIDAVGVGGEDEEADGGDGDDEEAEFLGEVFADEEVAAAAVRTGCERMRGRRRHA